MKAPNALQRLRDDQSGVVLVLTTLALVVLLGFAALSIDVGNQFAHRRKAQGAVDASALAGAIEASSPGATSQAAVDVIKDYVNRNLDMTVTDAQWVADCADPTPLAVTAADLGLVPATDCISFSLDEMRVSLPVFALDTIFARVVGVDQLTYTAAANVEWSFPGEGNPLPFAVPVSIAGGDEACLRTNPAPEPVPPQFNGNGYGAAATLDGGPDPCDDAVFTAGGPFFGTLNPFFFDEPNPSPPSIQCSRPGSNVIDYSIAAGIDHTPGAFEPDYDGGSGVSATNPVVVDGSNCPQNSPLSNTFDLQTGLTAQRLRCGLISTRAGSCADGPSVDSVMATPRLHQGSFVQSVHTFSGEKMDNAPLWDFIRSDIASASVPAACVSAYNNRGVTDNEDDYYDVKADMLSCLAAWSTGDDPIFSDSITSSGRFVFIPRIDESGFSSSPVHVNDYVPAFLQTLYQSGKQGATTNTFCWSTTGTGPNPEGWFRHEAGQDFSCGRTNDTVDRVSAIVIPCSALPSSICVDPNVPGPGGNPVLEYRLTK